MTITNTIKKTALALGAVVATAAPGMAQYTTEDGFKVYEASDFTGPHAEMITTLDAMGVPVLNGTDDDRLCAPPAEDGSYTLGWYTPVHNVIVLCHGDMAQRSQTLTHEVVHVIQDARGGLNNSEMGEMTRLHFNYVAENISDRKAQTIVSLYDKKDWVVEAEAFFYQDSPEIVSDALKSFVF